MRTVNRLRVAKDAHEFTLQIYRTTENFPQREVYGLQSQIRRAAVSIGSNIAEGDAHNSNRVFIRHLSIAIGSAGEVDYQLLLARDLGYLSTQHHEELAHKLSAVRGSLIALMQTVAKRPTEKS